MSKSPLLQIRDFAISRKMALTSRGEQLNLLQRRALDKIHLEYNHFGHLPANKHWYKVKELSPYIQVLLPSEYGRYHKLRYRMISLMNYAGHHIRLKNMHDQHQINRFQKKPNQ